MNSCLKEMIHSHPVNSGPQCGNSRKENCRRLSPLLVTVVCLLLGVGPSSLWAKRASELQQQRNPGKTGYERSKLAARQIPETPRSVVHAGNLNKIVQEEFRRAPGMLGFTQKYGYQWQGMVDERSMTPMMLWGEGIPFTTRSAVASKAAPSWQTMLAPVEDIRSLEATARQFLTDNQEFLKVDPGALQIDLDSSGTVEAATGKYRLVFQNTYQGIPILDSYVSMFISHGNMILYGAEHIDKINIRTVPALSRRDAVLRLGQSLGLADGDVRLDHAADLFITLLESQLSKTARSAYASSIPADPAFYSGPVGQGYEPRLVYKIQFHIPDDSRSLVALLDANTGELMDLFDQNRYQSNTGNVKGAIYTRGPVSTVGFVNSGSTQAPEYIVPFDRFSVVNGSTTVNTNPGGIFNLNGLNPGGFLATISGFQARVIEYGSPACPAPQGPADTSGSIFFPPSHDDGRCSTNAGSPAAGNGLATHGALNGWFHANFAITHAQKFLSNFNPQLTAFFNTPFYIIVNNNVTLGGCDASWSLGCRGLGFPECMNLGSCGPSSEENNQADEPDTMSHEYGHALDYHTKPGGTPFNDDRGKEEGLADIDAWLNTHRTCLSPGDGFGSYAPPYGSFFKGLPIGDLCNTSGFPLEPQALWQTGVRDYNVFICHDNGSGACPAGTTGRLQSNDSANACGTTGASCTGSLGYECHCEGHTTSGSVIDLFKLLVTRYGTNQAWYMIERLYYLALPGITGAYATSGAASTYANFLAVDDDDGNLANGTPNGDLIYQAFRAHGTEGTAYPRGQANCTTAPGPTSPATPSGFSAVAQGPAQGGILLQWNSVPGASGYNLYRTAASQQGHNYENDSIPSSYYGRNGVFFSLINPSTRNSNPNSGTNYFATNGTGTQTFVDTEVAPGYEYFYQIQAVTPYGSSSSCYSTLSPSNIDLVVNATAPNASSGGNSQANMAAGNGGAVTSSTIGSTGVVQAGYAVSTLNSGTAPYGTAVFSLTQNGTVVSEVGIPSSPPTTHAKIFIDFRTGVSAKSDLVPAGTISINTGFAAVNRGSSTATVNYKLYDFTGVTPLASGNGTIAPGAHFSKFMDQLRDVAPDFLLPANFSTSTRYGSLEITSSQPLSIVALRLTNNQRGDTLITSTPIADLNQALGSGNLYFPQLVDGGGYSTVIVMLNTSSTTETGSLLLYADSGSPLIVHQVNGSSDSTFNYNIQPGGFYIFQTDGSPQNVNAGSVRLIPDPGTSTPVGAGIFSFTQNGTLVTESGIPSAIPTSHARIYVDESGGHDTGLAISAPGSGPVTATITAYQMDGTTQVGTSSGPVNLNGNGHMAKFVGQLVTGLPSGFTGVLDIASYPLFGGSTPFAALTLRSLNNSRGDFLLTTFPIADATQAAPDPLVFPQIADGGGYKTQFILIGMNGSSSVTLRFYGDDGTLIYIGQ